MWKKRNFPEVSSDLCQDIMKGRDAFVIPGCLCNRNALVTTPHGCKTGASGMTRVCRPTPVVRFMHTSETKLTATCVSHGTCRLLGRSCFYPRELTLEPANAIELSVCKRTTPPFFCEKTKVERVSRPAGGALFIPKRERRGIQARIGK
jgi:hypothetical protein